MSNSKMIKCKVCGEEIAKSAKTCPKCGARNKRGVRFFVGALLFFVGVLILTSAFGGGGKDAADISGQNAIQAMNNKVASTKLEEAEAPCIVTDEYGIKTINGSFKNISDTSIYYAQISFALFDDSGAQVGSAFANINNLAKDAVWKFSATPLTTEDFTSFELSEIAVS